MGTVAPRDAARRAPDAIGRLPEPSEASHFLAILVVRVRAFCRFKVDEPEKAAHITPERNPEGARAVRELSGAYYSEAESSGGKECACRPHEPSVK